MLTTLGLFGKGMVSVPSLVGLSKTEAELTITAAGLVVGSSSSSDTSTQSDNSKTFSQSPVSGTQVDYETSVSFSYYNYVAPVINTISVIDTIAVINVGTVIDVINTSIATINTGPQPCCQDDDAGYCVDVGSDGYGTWMQYQYDPCTGSSCPPRNMAEHSVEFHH